MSDKGGKGSSLPPKGIKSSLKSTTSNGGSFKGKEDGSTKSKKGRKVQFDSDKVSPKSSGKTESLFSKGNTGKGGKGDNTASTVKKSPSKPPPPLELKVEQELPKNAKCIMDAEALQILQGIQDQMVILSEDPSIKIPASFDRGLQYAKTTGNRYTDYQSVRRILETLKEHGVTEGEICVIANVGPETADEVFALVPSLKGKKEKLMEPLKGVLDELAKLKQLA
ncbi:DNA-directed RNA polymerases IV and V subunit 4-like [Punica granatum]|uniref:DNA-directed RNA polymerases IV and V subunit 4-like n=1 Tax=Punica granatum TaxID=22663 RepID=A0A6P8DMB0_PUNGR|nr:DNA-directed RNA polymerases IV and V subunit 4-like [Punica granatum]